jgi:hypothetical protein
MAKPHIYADGDIMRMSGEKGVKTRKMLKAMYEAQAVEFTYDGKHRVVEVHAIGTSTKDESIIMRGFQTRGTASRPLPQWTLFSLSKVEDLKESTDESKAPREGYAQGDAQMLNILAEIVL